MKNALHLTTNADRSKLLNSLKVKLEQAEMNEANPVFQLVEKLHLETLSAMQACYQYYSNTECRRDAKRLEVCQPSQIKSLIRQVADATDKIGEAANKYAQLLDDAASSLELADDKKIADASLYYVSALDAFKNNRRKHAVNESPVVAGNRRRPKEENPVREQLDAIWCSNVSKPRVCSSPYVDLFDPIETFSSFLFATARLTSNLLKGCLATTDPTDILFVFLQTTFGNSEAFQKAVLGHSFEKIYDLEILEISKNVIELEASIIAKKSNIFPNEYTSPFGLVVLKKVRSLCKSDEIRHSFFASRVALASIFAIRYWEYGYKSTTDLPNWVLHHTWRNHVSAIPTKIGTLHLADGEQPVGRIDRELEPQWEDSIISKLISIDGLANEYDEALQWKKTLGKQGSIVTATHNFLHKKNRATSDDDLFLLELFSSLVKDKGGEFAGTALVALAAKIGVINGIIHLNEPTCSRPVLQLGQKSRIAATQQIDLIENLATTVNPNSKPSAVPIVSMAERTYYADGPNRKLLQKGFDWKERGHPWSELTSSRQDMSSNAVNTHLWLYGKEFHRKVESLIDNLKLQSEHNASRVGDRIGRYIFLIPYIKNKRLFDWDEMELDVINGIRVLSMIAKASQWRVYSDLTQPILGTSLCGDQNPFFSELR